MEQIAVQTECFLIHITWPDLASSAGCLGLGTGGGAVEKRPDLRLLSSGLFVVALHHINSYRNWVIL